MTEAGYVSGPDTPAALLAAGLQARPPGAPLAVISCDNVPRNGEVLRGLVGGAVRRPGADFPCTMVDRIVPATTDDDRAVAERLTGAPDRAPVVAEPFTQWVIEELPRRAPAWEEAGAMLVADTAPYETMKLRLLNGAHSALAHLGIPAGHETVAEAVADPGLRGVRASGCSRRSSRRPCGEVPGIDLAEYRRTMFERFANPRIDHRLEQIATGAEQKIPLRFAASRRASCWRRGASRRAIVTVIARLRARQRAHRASRRWAARDLPELRDLVTAAL